MPSETHGGNELEIAIANDDASADSKSTTEAEPDAGDGDLELNESKETTEAKPNPAEVSAKNQEEAWLRKVIDGKAEVTDAPKWLQTRLESRLASKPTEPDIDAVVERKLAQAKERDSFLSLKQSIPPQDAKTAAELNSYFVKYKALGDLEALTLAIRLSGAKMDRPDTGKARRGMALPPSGQPKERVSNDPKDIAKDSSRWKQWVREQDALSGK